MLFWKRSRLKDAKLTYLFSSGSRIPYIRDILDVLCYPSGYVLHFRYFLGHLSDDFKNPGTIHERLHNQRALVVYADIVESPLGTIYQFYPIRFATIVHPRISGSVLFVPMELHEFVDYGPRGSLKGEEWNQAIQSFADSPALGQKGRSFVIQKQQVPKEFQSDRDEQLSWESIVDRLSRTDRFLDSSFFRILRVTGIRDKELRLHRVKSVSYYALRSGEMVTIHLAFFHVPRRSLEGRKLKLIADSELFFGDVGRLFFSDSPYNQLELRLLIKRRFDEAYTGLRIQPAEWKVTGLAMRDLVRARVREIRHQEPLLQMEDDEARHLAETEVLADVSSGQFFAAVPELIVRLGTRWSQIYIPAIVFAIGTVLLAASPDFVILVGYVLRSKLLEGYPIAWSGVFRLMGGIVVALVSVYVFRKWPFK